MSDTVRPSEDGTRGATPERTGARRVGPGPWRLAVALLLGGGLVWTAAATDGTFGVQPGRTDGAAATGSGTVATFVRSASLACPGWPGDEATDRAGEADGAGEGDEALPVQVRAATAPEELGGPGGVGNGATLAAPEEGPQVRFPAGGRPDGLSLYGGWSAVAAGPDAAPGLVAAQLTLSPDQGRRGLSYTPCRTPSEVVRLLGGGAGAGRVEQVVVTNPGSDPVTATVAVHGLDGPVEVGGGTGLVVPPQGRTAYLLDALAPGVEAPVVTVTAEGGPVTAHLVEQQREGSVDLGVDVVPAAAEPARELVVPALPGAVDEGTGRTLTLRLFAPEEEAVVELRALTTEGAWTPDEPVVRVPAGSTVEVDLGGLDDDVLGLRLRSDAPVTAAARLEVAPSSDEPVVVEDTRPADDTDASSRTVGPDEAVGTAGPDDALAAAVLDEALATAAPDEALATGTPDQGATTAAPDEAGTTAAPDDVATTADPEPRERVVRPAGEATWVTATALSSGPVGTAIPRAGDLLPDGPSVALALAVSAVDGTDARVVWLGEDGAVSVQELELGNDTTVLLDVPAGTAAVWVRPVGAAGVAVALHLEGTDDVGPYLAAATLPAVPWTREPTQVLPALP